MGHTYRSFTYEVSREKLREYARATGVHDPALEADASEVPLRSLTAPPTFAACFSVGVLDQIIADPELGAHWNLLHGSQAFRFARPVRGGDVLRCTPRITDLTSRASMERLTLVVEAVEADTGEPVVEADSTILFLTGAAQEDAAPEDPAQQGSTRQGPVQGGAA